MYLKSVFFVSIGVLCLCCNVSMVQAQDCATNVQDCVTEAFEVFTAYANDIPRVCQATDEFLQCLVRETQTCDPVVASSIKESMSPMVDMYTTDPYNCKLESSVKDALKPDKCSQEMSVCSLSYLQAETEATGNYNMACKLFNTYLQCMNNNITDCDATNMDFIKAHVANATKFFHNPPLYCHERLEYPLDQVDKNMTVCGQVLQDMNMALGKQDYICGKYQDFFNCSVMSLMRASPRQFVTYSEQLNAVSASFQVRPYFCDSENPCMALFKDCNQSAYNPGITPCDYMDVYRSCLSNAHQYCGEAQYITLATNTQIMIGELHDKYHCIEENMNNHFDDTTPVAEPTDNTHSSNMEDKEHTNNDNTDTMQNDGPIHTPQDQTTKEEDDSKPSKPGSTPTKEPKTEAAESNMATTKQPQSGSGSSGSNPSGSSNNVGDDDSSGTGLQGSFWISLLTTFLLVIKPRL